MTVVYVTNYLPVGSICTNFEGLFLFVVVVIELHCVGFAIELIKYELMDSLQRYAVFSTSDLGFENMIVTDQCW